MTPAVVDLSVIQKLLGAALWSLGRVSGLCLLAPVFSDSSTPQRIRIVVILILTMVLTPLAPAAIDPLSGGGVATFVQEMLIGASLGFILKMLFEAVSMAGQFVGLSMNLGFAQTVDPSSGETTPVLSQFYSVVVTLLFLSLDGHLQLIALLAESFKTLPPGTVSFGTTQFHTVSAFALQMFIGAVRVAIPAMGSLLLVNIGFGAISRASPALNLFAVGFPITLTLGMLTLWLALRSLPPAFQSMQGQAWTVMRSMVGL